MTKEEIVEYIKNGSIEGEVVFFNQFVDKDGDVRISGLYEGNSSRLSGMIAGLMLQDDNFRQMVLIALDKMAKFAAVSKGFKTTDEEYEEYEE